MTARLPHVPHTPSLDVEADAEARGWYELAEHWWKETDSGDEIDIPSEAFKAPGEYRVRARWRDQTGRCGHWSSPVDVSIR